MCNSHELFRRALNGNDSCLVRLSRGTNLFGPVCLTLMCSSPTHCRGTFLKPRPLACSKCAARDPHFGKMQDNIIIIYIYIYFLLVSGLIHYLSPKPSKHQCFRSAVQFLPLFTTYIHSHSFIQGVSVDRLGSLFHVNSRVRSQFL